jgi:hypothetical protein
MLFALTFNHVYSQPGLTTPTDTRIVIIDTNIISKYKLFTNKSITPLTKHYSNNNNFSTKDTIKFYALNKKGKVIYNIMFIDTFYSKRSQISNCIFCYWVSNLQLKGAYKFYLTNYNCNNNLFGAKAHFISNEELIKDINILKK